jgi:ATP-dependent RNA helicase CshB
MDDSFSPLIFSFLQRFESTQLLIFSASFNQHLIPKFKAYIHADHVFEDDTPTINSNAIVHKLIDIRHQSPVDAIMKCIQLLNPFRLIIFASTVQKVKMISESLIEHQLPIATMHGELAFRERKSLLKRIQNGQYQIIVASDMAARGMDFPDVSDVISVDLPKDITYYYHRAGRTGRLNKTGTSYVFHQKDDAHLLKRLEQQGVKFLPFVLKDNALTPARAKRTFKPQEDTQFKRDLKKAMHQSRSSKVKPGYKRKVKRAVEKVKKQYKRKAINAKIRKRLFGGES